jgi:DNA-binding transcriptional regulator YhcF (GntR family)
MKLWLSRNSTVPLREQLTRQVILGIVSGDLGVGEKLPSVREIALRFKIHQNTVSSAYQWLEENGWVDSRQGSGVFIRQLADEQRETVRFQTENELDSLIAQFFRQAQRNGYSQKQIQERFNRFISTSQLDKILIVESEEVVRHIIFTEISAAIDFPVFGISPKELDKSSLTKNSLLVTLTETKDKLRPYLPANADLLTLKFNSAQAEMKGQSKPAPDQLIGVVSSWKMFLRWSQIFLVAAGIDAETLLLRDARDKNFRKGLDSCLFVITDSETAKILPKHLDIRVFKLIAEDSLEKLKRIVKE